MSFAIKSALFFTVVIAVWTYSINGDKVQDSIRLKISKASSISQTKMKRILKKANLKSRGYRCEQISRLKLVDGKKEKSVTFLYYKIVPCDQVKKVEQELSSLLGHNIISPDMTTRLDKDLKKEKITTSGQTCKVGFEVLFPTSNTRKRGWLFTVKIEINISVEVKT